jgi:hypothetical protein
MSADVNLAVEGGSWLLVDGVELLVCGVVLMACDIGW